MKIRNILILIGCAIALTGASLWMGQQAYSWFPPQAAAESKLIDELFSFLVSLGTFIFLGVTGTVTYSIIFHRAGKYDTSDGPPIEGNITLEVVWTTIPILLVLWIATYSYNIYAEMAIQGPMEAMHIHTMASAHAATMESTTEPIEKIEVLAKQWAWVFRYPNQNVTSTELHLPVNRRISLALQSADVLHGFYIPAFRLKQDIVPKQTIDFEFTPIRPGKYRLRDSQFSGTYFAAMQTDVVVQSIEDYNHWLKTAATQKPTPANNQAANEYTQKIKGAFTSGYPTVIPAPPPLVNFPS
ncbi:MULTISPECIES: cytochrome c oxidase subunit II [unclassified Tolypothrix]|uniref:cytochrome c oxidase subunit II n=1 Tax=unclassified Tolypothrix TaxID=2649714 RepID=UPI0005EAB67B|nr:MULTISPECIES: cytochrome c oxidase subunit II [unclassified Tolypothrix]BAY91373.1 cytochrome c oxidase subunit II [Microchaete diplosiphon NIES-3275]EKF04498.1 cytochrome c oxidase subunit [Tolypothrix sp. PCC 7601]MBE9080940.1 cytochrome c oxidase subunit II [Tolypothrix sp. LEGE 11397]UYD25426.1 cytochrome c oxidase subunit II [Tolypothrix sp. PCC 7712]UYD32329.1 cytochrome c oxidase subunit II [Tolypothrix sp. PCC 7601]